MESRLPKPKIMIKANSITDITVKNNNHKITKNNNTSTSASTLTSISTSIGLTSMKSVNENKLPVEQTLVRAKTLSTITRSNVKAIKRTATNITHGEAKKPLVKSVAKALVNKPNNNALMTNNTVNKVQNKIIQNNIDNKASKIKKWDLRGRLAQTSDKLSVAQQKNKDLESKYNMLQELANTSKTNETAYKAKAEKLEVLNNTLTNELQTLTVEILAIRKNEENLVKQLKESEESCTSLSHTLNQFQEKCKTQEVLISEQTKQLTVLKTDLKLQKEMNEDLSIVKEKLQALTHKMDKERRILHNTIQELKGNIRVFCRVRPRTPKETEQMKA